MPPKGAPTEEDDDDAPSSGPPPRSRGRSAKRPPVRRWSDEEDEPDEAGSARKRHAHGGVVDAPPPGKERVYFRARDSVYFEPAVALMVIVVLLVGLFAYTQNWPPMYVVESDSMQHGYDDQVGLINTGDLVLAQKVSVDQITPYVVGAKTGYSTYGEYGDVILYHPNGDTSGAPIIHRALIYIVVNAGVGQTTPTYDFTELSGQACGNVPNPVYTVSDPLNPCATTNVPSTASLTLYHVGWRSVNVVVSLASLGGFSGFLTMGDNNIDPENPTLGDPDQPFLSSLVQPAWIVGAARGMLPWFGSFKLLLEGNSGEVPPQSWSYMGLTLIAIVGVAILLHLFLRAEGFVDVRRKAREEERRRSEQSTEDEDEDDDPPSASSWRHPLGRWRRSDEVAEGKGQQVPPGASGSVERRTSYGGRPRPEVGRSKRTGHRKSDSTDDDDGL